MDMREIKKIYFDKVRSMRMKVVDFLNKGATRKKTKMKLKELTEERLKKIPNYLAIEVARQRIDLTKDGVIIGLFTIIVLMTYMVVNLSSKLDKRIVALIPSRIEKITEVEPGEVPPGILFRKVSSYVSLLGNVDSGNVNFNYDLLRDVMSDELKVKFWADSTQFRQVIRGKRMSQTVSFNMKDIQLSTRGKVVSAVVRVRVKPMYGDEIGKVREEYILFEGTVAVRKEDNFWELELFNLEQGPVEDMGRVKRRIKGGA